MKKFVLFFITALIYVLVLSGCSYNNKTNVILKSRDVENTDNSWDMVVETGSLKIGIAEDSLPYAEKVSHNKYKGFLIDIIEEIAKVADIDVEYVEIADDTITDLLNSNSIDIVLNGYTQADLGNKAIKWVGPYMKNNHIIVSYYSSDINSKNDLENKKIGVAENTLSDILAQSDINIDNDKIIKFETEKKALDALRNRQIDALIIEDAYFYYYQRYNTNTYNISDEIVSTHLHSLGISSNDNQIADKIGQILANLKAEGTLKDISEKWFNTNLTQ